MADISEQRDAMEDEDEEEEEEEEEEPQQESQEGHFIRTVEVSPEE